MGYSRYYNNRHNDSDEHCNLMIQQYKKILIQYLSAVPLSAKIMEIGSGMGFAMLALKELGYKNIVGVDLDEPQTLKAKKRGLDVFNVSAESYFKNAKEKFDVVLMFDVLEHIKKKDIIPLLSNIYSNLNSDGKLIVQTPNCYSLAGSAYRHGDFTHEISFSPYSLDFVLFNADFRNIKVSEVGSVPKLSCKKLVLHPKSFLKGLLKVFLRRLYKLMLSQEVGRLDGVPLSANIVAVAIK